MSFIGLLYIFFGSLGQFLVNGSRILSLVMTCASCLFAVLFYRRKRRIVWKWFAASTVVNSIGLFSTGWYFFTLPALWNVFWGILLLISGRRGWNIEVFRERERRRRKTREARRAKALSRHEKQRARRTRIILRFLVSAGKGFVFVFAVTMLLFTFAPGMSLRFLRENMHHTLNRTEAVQREEMLSGGLRRFTDICYDTEIPNGYLDIIYAPVSAEAEPMTVIYIHGGGFVWGDKAEGDPNVRIRTAVNSTIMTLAKAGYNVVSMNYALAPEYPYPFAIKQLNRGLRYLKEHAQEWHLNMESVAFAGFSAGGNLEGVLANIQTNPLCAAVVGEEPVLSGGELKGIIFEGSLLDYHRFGDTGDAYYDYAFYTMGRVYFGSNDLMHDKRVNDCNILPYVTKDFPPSFISDGNTGTYYRQAAELYEILTELGIYAELNYYPVEEAGILGHGFEEDGSEWSDLTMQKMIRFLQRIDPESGAA